MRDKVWVKAVAASVAFAAVAVFAYEVIVGYIAY